jgi:hypothetical protein
LCLPFFSFWFRFFSFVSLLFSYFGTTHFFSGAFGLPFAVVS